MKNPTQYNEAIAEAQGAEAAHMVAEHSTTNYLPHAIVCAIVITLCIILPQVFIR